jgi:hypothetical protein
MPENENKLNFVEYEKTKKKIEDLMWGKKKFFVQYCLLSEEERNMFDKNIDDAIELIKKY